MVYFIPIVLSVIGKLQPKDKEMEVTQYSSLNLIWTKHRFVMVFFFFTYKFSTTLRQIELKLITNTRKKINILTKVVVLIHTNKTGILKTATSAHPMDFLHFL